MSQQKVIPEIDAYWKEGLNNEFYNNYSAIKFVFTVFLVLTILSQIFMDIAGILSILVFAFSMAFLAFLLMAVNKTVFLAIFALLNFFRFIIPGKTDYEIQYLLPAVFFFIFLFRFMDYSRYKLLKRLPKSLTALIIIFLTVFLVGIKIPGLSSGNTGIIARIKLLNVLIAFGISYSLFEKKMFMYIRKYLYSILIVLGLICAFMYLFSVDKLPLFNTFSWSILREASGSIRFGIAGVIAIMLAVYAICYKIKHRYLLYALIFLLLMISGGRSSMFALLFLMFLGYFLKRKKVYYALTICVAFAAVFLLVSLSPLILYLPGPLQRLAVVLPSEFYSGSLSQLSESSAASSSAWRYMIWGMAVTNVTWSSFLFGNGFGVPEMNYTFSEGFGTFNVAPEVLMKDFMSSGNLHNTFISIFYLSGIFAVILFIIMVWAVIKRAYKYYKITDDKTLLFILLFILSKLIDSFFGDIHFSVIFWIFLGIVVKYFQIAAQESKLTSNKI